jgi:hypothetical protein
MRMVTEAWDAVAPSTIANCWNHAKVQPDAIPCTTEVLNATSNASMNPTRDPRAWKVIHTFAMSEMRLPEAENQLKEVLGSNYAPDKWFDILKIVMDAENDVTKALDGLDQVTK